MKTRKLAALLNVLMAGGLAHGQSPATPELPAVAPGAAATPAPDAVPAPAPSATVGVPHADAAAEPAHPTCGPDCDTCCGDTSRFFGGFEYLIWWTKGASLPTLVTTSPSDTPRPLAGVLTSPNGTSVLFGGEQEKYNANTRSGVRAHLGYWFDEHQTWGVEAHILDFETKATGFFANSDGSANSQILARPFSDITTTNGAPASGLVAYPGAFSGSVQASLSSTGLVGAGFDFHENLAKGSHYRVDVLAGFRWLRFSDHLGIAQHTTVLTPQSTLLNSSDTNQFTVGPGSAFDITDRFDTRNNFDGFDFGLCGDVHWDNWWINWVAKAAAGWDHESLDIHGQTTITTPGGATTTSTTQGGFLALSSNSGHFAKERVPVIPELGLTVGYQVTSHIQVFAGYTVLFWDHVIRPGENIDLAINPNLLPPVQGTATPARPAPLFEETSWWTQGVNLGFEFRF